MKSSSPFRVNTITRVTRIAAGIATLLPMIQVNAQSSRAVKDFTPCDLKQLTIAETERLPERPMVRTVETSRGERDVTMVDGYRIFYFLDPDEPMLNMKMEILEPSTYQQQKADLIDDLELLSKDPTNEPVVKKSSSKAISGYTITRKRLEGGVLSISELFDDPKNSVTTIYYLNDEPARRQFKTMEKFLILRDEILSESRACMAGR